jgi:DNA-binding winged helix-turn-helix (wHTH) protein/predicted ATPase
MRHVVSGGKQLKLSSRAFDILQVLIQANGELVSVDELLAKVWPKTVVEENNVQVHICGLRKALGEHKDLLKTIAGRGYRLLQASTVVPADDCGTNAVLVSSRAGSIPLFGMRDAVDRSLKALNEARGVMTITGAPGVGKSRLCEEIVDELRRSEVQVMLVSLGNSDDKSARPQIDAAVDRIRSSPSPSTVLVLDDCDLVHSAVRDSLAAIDTCPVRPSVIATSRCPLKIARETNYRLEPLPVYRNGNGAAHGPAMDMFWSCVQSIDSAAHDDHSTNELAAQIVEMTDGLPLAIAIAGRHSGLFGLESVLALFSEGIDLTTKNVHRFTEERHQNVNAAWSWSWSKLSATQRLALGAIAGAAEPATFEDLVDLLMRNMLTFEESVDAITCLIEGSFIKRCSTAGRNSYKLLSTLRRYIRCTNVTQRPSAVGGLMQRGDPTLTGSSLLASHVLPTTRDSNGSHRLRFKELGLALG